MNKELLVTCRESRVVSYFRSITPGQQDAVESILAKLNGEQTEIPQQQPLPANVLAFERKA